MCGDLAKNFPLSANASVFPPICLIDWLRVELSKRENWLDVLVINAGASWTTAFDHFSEAGWDKVMDLNVKSVFFLTQRLVYLLEAAATSNYGAGVINIGSIEGMRTMHLEAYSYAASKSRG